LIGLRLFIPWLPRGVMDMEYLDSVAVDPIKNLVWIAAKRHDVNARAMGGARRVLSGQCAICAMTRLMRRSTAGATVG
jgi:hypothetical protein